MTFSYDRAWGDIVVMARTNRDILIAVGGVFLLVPYFLQGLVIPDPVLDGPGVDATAAMLDYVRANGPMLFALQLPAWLGEAALFALLADPRRPTVAEAIGGSLPLLPSVIVLNLLTNLLVLLGLFAFVVPGIYLIGRLFVGTVATVAERLFNPLAGLQRAFALTERSGWRVAGLVVLFSLVAWIVALALRAVVGSGLALLLPVGIAAPVVALLEALVTTSLALTTILLAAAIYRQLARGSISGI